MCQVGLLNQHVWAFGVAFVLADRCEYAIQQRLGLHQSIAFLDPSAL